MKLSELTTILHRLELDYGDMEVSIDDGMALRQVEDVDLGASDEGIVIWAGDMLVEAV